MKFSKYFMFAGLTALMAACSSEEPLVKEPDGIPMPAEVAETDSYALISLEMPAQSSTRAAQATTTDVAAENQVINGAIMLFEKEADGSDFNYIGKYDISTAWEDNNKPDINRTTHVHVGFPKGTFKTANSYKTLVVLNYPSTYIFPTAPQPAVGETPAKKGQKYEDWAEDAKNYDMKLKVGSNEYLTMISAAKYNTTSKYGNVLVDLDPSKIKSDMNMLLPTDAIEFYVHRVAAKVSIATPDNSLTYTIAQGENTGAKVELLSWDVEMVEKNSYPVQYTKTLDLSAPHMHTGQTEESFANFPRCSWSKSPSYDNTYTSTTLARGGDLTSVSSLGDEWVSSYKYVRETTMPAQQQIKSRSPRVVLKAKYTAKDATDASTLVKVGNLATVYMSKADLLALIKTKAEVEFAKTNLTVTAKETSFNSGYYSLTEFCDIKDGDTPLTTEATLNEIAKDLGLTSAAAKEIALYKDGICYYYIRIRHFDNGEASIGTKEIKVGTDYEDSHLGRYGMVRNNWYEVNITSITKIGKPIIPTPNDDADDKPEDEVDAMNFNINMLNWAKRTQNETL